MRVLLTNDDGIEAAGLQEDLPTAGSAEGADFFQIAGARRLEHAKHQGRCRVRRPSVAH